MNKYYQNELDKLHQDAVDFAQKHPTLAPHLATQSVDPDVERILEGVAYLTSQIREKLDDDFPEFSQGLLKQIFPHYLRPLPSATIIKFKPKTALKDKLVVAAGTYVDSSSENNISCRFSTCYNMDVYPMEVVHAELGETAIGQRYIDIVLQLNNLKFSDIDSDTLRFHLSGDYHGAVDLFYLLLNKVDGIEFLSSSKSDPISSNNINIKAVGFEDGESLLTYPTNSFPTYRLIQEYFLLKEKFLFIDINNVSEVFDRVSSNQLIIRAYLSDSVQQLPKINADRFVLNASPAINIFEHEAESILNDHKRSEYQIRPLRNVQNQYQVYSVESVIGQNRRTAEKTEYRDLGLADPLLNDQAVYNINFKQIDGQHQVFLRLSYPESMDLDAQESLSIKLKCSNGALAANLKAGEINKPTHNTTELLDFENILQPSEYQQIPSGGSMLWRLLSHLSLNYLSLADTDNLKALLGLYIFSSGGGSKQELANRKRVSGINEIKVTSCDRLIGGVSMRGQAINVVLNPAHYASLGDMYLFGSLLDRLFSSFASLNCFTEFSLTDEATDIVYSWPPRAGDRPLI